MREEQIKQIITTHFSITYFELENESQIHGNPQGESHFRLLLVSSDFYGYTRLQREQKINGLLKTEFSKGLHALSCRLYTKEEWEKKGKLSPPGSECHRVKG